MTYPKPGIQNWTPKLVVLLVSLALWALLLLGCSDATGPSEQEPMRPQFQKVYQGDVGGAGGGGGGSSQCTRPTASVECALKAAGLTVTGGVLAACSLAGCIGGFPAWSYGAYDYLNTPDCRSCGTERSGVGTGRSMGPTDPWNLPPGSPPDGD